MKILFVTGEAWPFIKTGGLGDVSHSLPKSLSKSGVDIRVIMPKYKAIDYKYKSKMKHLGHTFVRLSWRNQYCGVDLLEYDGVKYYFIDNEHYFKRDNIYGEFDDCERFGFFSKAVLAALEVMEFKPDIIHCNDWHSGLTPVYLKELQKNKKYTDIKTLFTIHNLKYQGIFSMETLGDVLGLSHDIHFREDSMKYYDAISFLKGGVNASDFISTVSEAYADEIKTEFFGENLHGLFQVNNHRLSGIINGIDYDIFNPRKDKDIEIKFGQSKVEKKVKNKLALQKELGLTVSEEVPMIGIITRLVRQKGLDLITHVLQELLQMDIQIVLLGTGDQDYEDIFEYYSQIYPSKLSSNIGYSETLAKKIYASSDMFLMPSLFEPCGLSQMISMRYGTVPIVRETGGLKDTVKPYNAFTNEGTGFTFRNYNAHEMLKTVKNSVEVYKDKKAWKELVLRCMNEKNSWSHAAKNYKSFYKEILG
jgi:starch synthase